MRAEQVGRWSRETKVNTDDGDLPNVGRLRVGTAAGRTCM